MLSWSPPRPHRRELRDVPAGPAASIAIVCREHGGERAGHEKAPANGSGIRALSRLSVGAAVSYLSVMECQLEKKTLALRSVILNVWAGARFRCASSRSRRLIKQTAWSCNPVWAAARAFRITDRLCRSSGSVAILSAIRRASSRVEQVERRCCC